MLNLYLALPYQLQAETEAEPNTVSLKALRETLNRELISCELNFVQKRRLYVE